MNARKLLEGLTRALGIVYGEFTVKVEAKRPTIIRKSTTLKPEELEALEDPEPTLH